MTHFEGQADSCVMKGSWERYTFFHFSIFSSKSKSRPLNAGTVSLSSMILPHYLSVSHPSEGLTLFAVMAVPPTIKNLTSYGVIIFFSSYRIRTVIKMEKVSLSFSSKDLMMFWKSVCVKQLFMFLTRSNRPVVTFSTAFSNRSI